MTFESNVTLKMFYHIGGEIAIPLSIAKVAVLVLCTSLNFESEPETLTLVVLNGWKNYSHKWTWKFVYVSCVSLFEKVLGQNG